MPYFYDYFAKEYRERHREGTSPVPAAILQGINAVDVERCRGALKNSFAGYREGRNAKVLKRLLGEYREYVSCCHDEHAKERYNAFVYRYMVEAHAGSRAIAAKLGVTGKAVQNYINRCFDEMLMLCMGMPAAAGHPKDREEIVCMLTRYSRLFNGMAGDYVLCLFGGEGEKAAVEQGRRLTRGIMGRFTDAVREYSGYCNDKHTRIDTDVRKAGILKECLAGALPAAIAKEFGCCESTIYADMRENEKRLAAMLFAREE